jgi:hypothetical protein
MDIKEALQALRQLAADLREIAKKDQEQEVRGMALPVLDAVVSAARTHVPESDPVYSAVREVISVESVEDGEPIRAIDALLVVNQLVVALERYEPPSAPITMTPEPGPFDRW